MPKKINVAVLMGGKSAERKISLITGKEIAKNLDRKKYNVLPLVIPQGDPHKALNRLKKSKIDLVFIAMHGPNGEDGTMQGFLELISIPYTGSGVLASALGIDKIYSRKLFIQSGLNVPKNIVFKKRDRMKKLLKIPKFPLFVKPSNQGSSVGTTKAKDKKELKRALKIAFSYSDSAIIEEYLKGTEITCAIIGNDNPKALPLVEIVPKKEFFDLEAKYDANLTDEIVPARIEKVLAKKAQDAAIKAYKALGCRGFGRVDMILSGRKVFVLEINTIPGLTPVSLFPKAAQAAGISYPKLLDQIINLAINP